MIEALRRYAAKAANKPLNLETKVADSNAIKVTADTAKHAAELQVMKAMVTASLNSALKAEAAAKAALAALSAMMDLVAINPGPTAKRVAAIPVPAGWTRNSVHCIEKRSA